MPMFWGALAAVLGNLVATRGGYWLASIAAAFGLALFANHFLIDPVLDDIQQAATGFTAEGLAWFRYLRCDQFITTVLSAYAAASTMSAVRLVRRSA